MAWGRRVCIFSFYDWGWAVWSGHIGAWVVLSVVWSASCSLLVRRSQVAIFNVCYEWRICSVWQVAWERMNGCSYVIERTMQSSSLLREGGLRNDAAGAALWRTRPYECAIDECQLLTMVIADVCRELSFFIFNVCYEWRICSVWQVVSRTLVRFVVRRYLVKLLMY